MSNRINLYSLNRAGLSRFCDEMGLDSYRSDQLFYWLYVQNVDSFDEMTNLSKATRKKLSDVAALPKAVLHSSRTSRDGTEKFLFRLFDGRWIESVLIPEFDETGRVSRLTICVSSQVGCLFNCSFCATGKMGLLRNLTIGEITGQVLAVHAMAKKKYGKRITNIVYMGMGEPFHNYGPVTDSAEILCDPGGLHLSPRRITLSTVGLTSQIRRYAKEKKTWNLAISLHAADDAKRSKLMPVNKKMNLEKLKEAITFYHQELKQPVTYEYLLFDGFNDGSEDARKLAKIAHWVPSKVNIIVYNRVEGVPFKRAAEKKTDRFLGVLTELKVRATVRRNRGDDIEAGCGQLAILKEKGEQRKL